MKYVIYVLIGFVAVAFTASIVTAEDMKNVEGENELLSKTNMITSNNVKAEVMKEGDKAVPCVINFQGYLTDAAENPVDETLNMVFTIWDAESGSNSVWSSGNQSVEVSNGIFSKVLSVPYSVFSGGYERWMQLEVDGQTLSPRVQITSIGYAYRTIKADTAEYSYTSALSPHDHFGECWSGDADTALSLINTRNSSTSAYGLTLITTNSSSGDICGTRIWSENTSTGEAVGEDISAHASGDDAYGIDIGAITYGDYDAHGIDAYSRVENGDYPTCATGVGGYAAAEPANNEVNLFGGSFTAGGDNGTGDARGVLANGRNNGPDNAYGVYAYGSNYGSGDAYGGYFKAYSGGTGSKYGVYAEAPVISGSYAGYFDGNFAAVNGSKSALVKADDGNYYHLYCQESPEVWFEDIGKGKLVNGEAVVEIDPLFAQTSNTTVEYHVFLTPYGECNGLAVTKRMSSFFKVKELFNGSSSIEFGYRIVAKRRGFENLRLEPFVGKTPEEIAAEQEGFRKIAMEKEKERLIRKHKMGGNN